MTDELTEINRRVNNMQYVPSEEAAMTAILWRDPEELILKNSIKFPLLLKVRASATDIFYHIANYPDDISLVDNRADNTRYFSCYHRECLYVEIIAWTPLPKVEGEGSAHHIECETIR